MTHPVVKKAAGGQLPAWARLDEKRRRHVERVAGLLEDWAIATGLATEERVRWIAAGYLHDALKGALAGELRDVLGGGHREFPESLLHGPAVAARLREDGVDDEELLAAVAYHTLGHPDLGRTGWALYAADFLDPGRNEMKEWRASLRARMPRGMAEVVKEIVPVRVSHLLQQRMPLRWETVEFWNRMAEGQLWAGASEL